MEKVKKMNYQKELEKLIVKLEKEEKVPRLLLHSCCAPCSSYVLEYLSNYFDITVFYYNPTVFLSLATSSFITLQLKTSKVCSSSGLGSAPVTTVALRTKL